MTKVTLDMTSFKALASDTRLDILRALDGKKMSLKDISKVTKLNKATLHEHLQKLNEAGLVKKKEREGHKWVYYKLSWKGEGLLHPENTRIVIMFSATFVALAVGIIQLINFVRGYVVAKAVNTLGSKETLIFAIDNGVRNIEELDLGGASQTPVASVSIANQTKFQLSQTIIDNIQSKGIVYNTLSTRDVSWAPGSIDSSYAIHLAVNKTIEGNEITDGVANVQSTMYAIIHDPALQWIGIICLALFGILLAVSIWKYNKNKKPKL